MVANPVSNARLLSLWEISSILQSQLRMEAGGAGKGTAEVIFKVAEVISFALVIPAGCDFPPTSLSLRNQSVEEGDRGCHWPLVSAAFPRDLSLLSLASSDSFPLSFPLFLPHHISKPHPLGPFPSSHNKTASLLHT